MTRRRSNLRAAREAYAAAHKQTCEQAAKVDPSIVLGEWYFRPGVRRTTRLPGATACPTGKSCPARPPTATASPGSAPEQPANVFLGMLSDFSKIVLTFARTDRQLAGLTAVEALRSYAAANGGKLPARLDDVNGHARAAESGDGEAVRVSRRRQIPATLSDPTAEAPMTYTIRIRKVGASVARATRPCEWRNQHGESPVPQLN
jgi:hypothetical protein